LLVNSARMSLRSNFRVVGEWEQLPDFMSLC
jgi:hypothetical protein